MPLLEVELIMAPDEMPRPTLSAEIAAAAATVFHSPPGSVWVRLRRLLREDYAENDVSLPGDLSPVFVTVIHAHAPRDADLITEAAQLITALGHVTGRPANNIHLIYQPDGAGRVFFGGRPVA